MTPKIAGLVCMAVFYVLVFLVGVWASKRDDGDSSTESLLLAGRGIPLVVGVFTMTATWVGGGYINGTAEAVFDPARGLVWAQAPWGYAISLVLGGLFFAGPMRRAGHTTLLDPFEQRYGKGTAAVLFLPALVGEVFWSAAILAALGTTFGTILGFDFDTSILISASVAIGYTVFGGLWSVAYTDVVQLVCILGGLAFAVPYAVDQAGGMTRVIAAYTEQFGTAASLLPTAAALTGGDGWGNRIWYWLDMAFLLMLGGIPWQVYFQRVLSSRNAATAIRLSLLASIGCLIMAVPPIIIGAVGATVDWSAVGASPPSSPALVLPHVLLHLTPPLIAALGLGAVAAAVMSSVDSSVLSASSMFVWNVYRTLLRPDAGHAELRRVTRASVIAVGAAATWLALTVRSVYDLWYLCADLVYVLLFPQLLLVLFDARANRTGALAGLAVGLFLRLGGGEPVLGLPAFLTYPMQDPAFGTLFPFRTMAMVAGLLTIFLVSRATGDTPAPGVAVKPV